MISFILLLNFLHIVFMVTHAKSDSSHKTLGSVTKGLGTCQATILSGYLASVYLITPFLFLHIAIDVLN